MSAPRRWLLSADLGQTSDPTAIGLFERTPGGDVARSLERPDLGTSYPDIVRRLVAIARNPALAEGVDLLLDATGVGRPVVDQMREELRGTVGVRLVPITIGAGLHARHDELGYWTVPKRVLVTALQVAMQTGRIRFPRALPLGETLVREMRTFKLKVSVETGHQSFEAWRQGDHDDLVLMSAMAAWWSSTLVRPLAPDPTSEDARLAAEVKAAVFRRVRAQRWREREAERLGAWRRR